MGFMTVRIFRMSTNVYSIKIRRCGIIVNATTLHRTQNDTELTHIGYIDMYCRNAHLVQENWQSPAQRSHIRSVQYTQY